MAAKPSFGACLKGGACGGAATEGRFLAIDKCDKCFVCVYFVLSKLIVDALMFLYKHVLMSIF